MTDAATTQTREFQAEVRQLLHLMVHALYSNKEIFLRELISNAADATDKLSFIALDNDALYEGSADLCIRISTDKEAGTLTIADNGIGMTEQEVIENLGTIARSGTAEFLKQLSGDQKKDAHLIGQFGVGFYSAFIVAHRVEVFTRKAGQPEDQGVYWSSEGTGQFDIGVQPVKERGTRIVLHLKDDEKEFLENWRLRSLVHKYSDHIAVPVWLLEEVPAESSEEDSEQPAEMKTEWKQANSATALWTRNKKDISIEEYQDFYHHIAHDPGSALAWTHNRVEGKLEYTSLLFVPEKAPFDIWRRDAVHGLKLYIQRVFIMDDAEQFLPAYLRFVRGVVDSNDLSLNISRELLQNDKTVNSLRSALTRRVLDMLEKLAEEPEKYQTFWKAFGNVLKEGLAEDFSNQEALLKLLRFATTHSGSDEQNVSLADYVSRMQPGQDRIYYLVADSHTNALGSPLLEIFRKKGIEVLLLPDRIDEWVMTHVHQFDGKSFSDIARGDLDESVTGEDTTQDVTENEGPHADLTARIARALENEVQKVRISRRLVESPACLVVEDGDMGMQMRRILEAAGEKVPDSKPILEINPEHPLLVRLEQDPEGAHAQDLIAVIHEQARLAGGEGLKDAAGYVRRINKLLMELSPATQQAG